jgi:hypothetical protein
MRSRDERDDEPGEVEAHLLALDDIAATLRDDSRAPVRICAWCESACVAGDWYDSDLVTFAWRVDAHASHTICPECFARVLPNVPYPR